MDPSSFKQLTHQDFDLTEEAIRKRIPEICDVTKVKQVVNFENEKDITVIEKQYHQLCFDLKEHLEKQGYCEKHISYNLCKSRWESYMIISFKYSKVFTLSKHQKRKIKCLIKKFINDYHEQYQLPIKTAFDCPEDDHYPIDPNTSVETFSVNYLQNNDVNEHFQIEPEFALKHVLGIDEEIFNGNLVLSKKLFCLGKEAMRMLINSPKENHNQGTDTMTKITQHFDILAIVEEDGVKDVCYFKDTNVIVRITADNKIYHFQGLISKKKRKILHSFILPLQNEITIEEPSPKNEEIEEPPPVDLTIPGSGVPLGSDDRGYTSRHQEDQNAVVQQSRSSSSRGQQQRGMSGGRGRGCLRGNRRGDGGWRARERRESCEGLQWQAVHSGVPIGSHDRGYTSRHQEDQSAVVQQSRSSSRRGQQQRGMSGGCLRGNRRGDGVLRAIGRQEIYEGRGRWGGNY